MTRYDTIRHDKTHVSCKGHDMTQKDTNIFFEKKIFFSEIYFFNHSFSESYGSHYEISIHTFDVKFEFAKNTF